MYKRSKRDKKGMKYCFRFLHLKEVEAKNLANDLLQYKPKMSKHKTKASKHLDKRGHGVFFQLNKRIEGKILVKIMRKHKIKQNRTDVFASLLAQKNSAIIGVPEYVNEVLRSTHSNLTFSFTYVG